MQVGILSSSPIPRLGLSVFFLSFSSFMLLTILFFRWFVRSWPESRSACSERKLFDLSSSLSHLGGAQVPVVIPSSAVTMHPKGTPAQTSSVEVQVFEERVDLSNVMTWRQMIAVGVIRVVLARGELDKLEGPKYAARRAELRRKAGEAARARGRQAAAASQNEAEGATRQRRKRQEGERREWDDREVA